MVAWTEACKPKNEGGLGILDLKTHNKTLLAKHLHKFYNRVDLPWVHLTWNTFYIIHTAP